MSRLFCCLLLLLHTSAASSNTVAQFRTYFGDMEVELYEQHKPITVGNFIRYVRAGLYQNGIIHRCDPNFVIQGGGFSAIDPNIYFIPTFAPIPNEYGAGVVYSNLYGTIAMAKLGGDTNSATSQWFINLKDNPLLDRHDTNNYFTVFGKVIRGTNVLNVFKTFSYFNTRSNIIRDYSGLGAAFGELPLLSTNATFGDLLYVDITSLNVQVQKLANGSREISWNSVPGKTNYVEFTTNLPPSWHTLLVTNAVTNAATVIDSSTGASSRFYRVRAQY
jgi:cyclophilin family peptidyl-prolyl cis-trans isomerase